LIREIEPQSVFAQDLKQFPWIPDQVLNDNVMLIFKIISLFSPED